ncbi:MAG: hypothetical protein N2738_06095, partial [Thermodesulfovibrionales bacterium]|nr:hypothetical protein [Thermodesulfovibrionales bacterium]
PYLLKSEIKSIPKEIPYISAKVDKINKFKKITDNTNKVKIGICWSGSKTNLRTINRSIEIELLIPILKMNKDFSFYSLQLSDRVKDFDKLPTELRPFDLSLYINDFSDTAGIIYQMDIVITIDSSIAHLSGAIGKKTLLLINYSSDWRWLINRNDSPWYPTISIFRQNKPCDWTNVILDLKDYLFDSYLK